MQKTISPIYQTFTDVSYKLYDAIYLPPALVHIIYDGSKLVKNNVYSSTFLMLHADSSDSAVMINSIPTVTGTFLNVVCDSTNVQTKSELSVFWNVPNEIIDILAKHNIVNSTSAKMYVNGTKNGERVSLQKDVNIAITHISSATSTLEAVYGSNVNIDTIDAICVAINVKTIYD